MTLKLYVWEGVLTDYTDGIAFALATTVHEAKRMLIADGVFENLWEGTKLQGVKATVYKTTVAFHCWGGS